MDSRDSQVIEQLTLRFKALMASMEGVPGPTDLSYDQIKENISSILTKSDGAIKSRSLFHVKKRLKLEHLLDPALNLQHINALQIIYSVTSQINLLTDFSDESSWKKAIQLASGNPHRFKSPEELNRYITTAEGHLIGIANSAKTLKSMGYQIAIRGDSIVLTDESENNLIRDIEGCLRRLGGPTGLGGLFAIASKHYDPHQDRYHLVRRVGTVPNGFKPSFPFGYLLNLAVKWPGPPPIPESDNINVWKRLEDLSTSYTSLYDVQPSSAYEGMFQNAHSILPFLQKNAIYDLIFSISQLRPADLPKLLLGIFEKLDPERFQSICGWKLRDYISVQRSIYAFAQLRPHTPVVFTVKNIASYLGTTRPIVAEAVLRSISHDRRANSDFRKPHEATLINFQCKPLIRMPDDQYLLVNQSWCSIAFVEAISTILRNAGWKNLDQKLGENAEDFLRQSIMNRGVDVSWGKYSHAGVDGECDAVIETSDTIFFIEHKKKPLTRMSRSGTEVSLLVDTSKSLLDAQLQSGGHEILLRSNGHIDLKRKGKPTYRLEHKGRQIERMAIALTDFGSLQDRQVLKNFLTVLVTARFDTSTRAGKIASTK